jgi:hypothetical protein
MEPRALLLLRRKLCCGFLSSLKSIVLGRVWSRGLWIQWQIRYPLNHWGQLLAFTVEFVYYVSYICIAKYLFIDVLIYIKCLFFSVANSCQNYFWAVYLIGNTVSKITNITIWNRSHKNKLATRFVKISVTMSQDGKLFHNDQRRL